MSRITGVIVALATTAAVLTGSTGGAAAPPPGPGAPPGPADLPREIEGGVELTMADGDLLRVWAADSHRVVWSKRRDSATGAWGPREEVLRREDLFCGEVEGRTANGAVALLVQCDRHGYAEDQAPVASRAMWSPDGATWTSYTLDGEAHEEPGISPDGQNAVWPQHGRYATRSAAGFAEHDLDADGQEYTVTATISDTGQVSFLYGTCAGGRSRVVVLTRTGDAAPTRQEVDVDHACEDTNFANVDAHTTLFGYFGDPGQVAVIARADAASPWALTQVAPEDAPGLARVDRRLTTRFIASAGGPLVALGSRTGRRVRAQVFDPVAQAWGAAITVHESRNRCRWGPDGTTQPLAVVAAVVRCGGSNVVLTTRDGLAWQALRMGRRSLGQSGDGRYVAVPGPTSIHVISPELGVVTLPGGTAGRCDVVVPDGPQDAVQLVAAGGPRRWPTVLRHVSSDGTDRLGRFPTRTRGRCAGVEQSYDRPTRFEMDSTRIDQGQTVLIARRGDGWIVRTSRW
jgi:hypothetical protein